MDLAGWLDPGPEASLGALFLASFLAATVLPGGSEVVLLGVAHLHPERVPAALALATLGNTLGGMSTYLLARLLPRPRELPHLATLRRWGSPALVLAWAPVVGDALCARGGGRPVRRRRLAAPGLAALPAVDGPGQARPLCRPASRGRLNPHHRPPLQ